MANKEFVNELKRRIEFTKIMKARAKKKYQTALVYYLSGVYDNLLDLYKYMTGKDYKLK